MRARLQTPKPSCNVVTRYVLIFKTVFPITLSVHFILRVVRVILDQNQHIFIVPNVFIRWSHCSFFRSHHITSWIAFRAPVAWMYTKQLNHAVQRVVFELMTTVLQMAVLSCVTADHTRGIAGAPNFCIIVTSRGCLATRMLIARHSFGTAAPWRISSWPFVAVNVFMRIWL